MKTNNTNTEINDLIKRVKDCEETAQRELYDLLVLHMYNTAYRIVGNKDDTHDCLQNGFSIIFHKIDKHDPDKGAFISWATRIVINEGLRILRKKKQVIFEEVNEELIVVNESASPLENLEAQYLITMINSLPDQMRVIFNLYEIEGYSHREIAQQLGIAESTCRTYLMRAKLILKKNISQEKMNEKQLDTPHKWNKMKSR